MAQAPENYPTNTPSIASTSSNEYWSITHVPCYTGGGSHCEQVVVRDFRGLLVNSDYYQFKSSQALLRSMGNSYPRIEFPVEQSPDQKVHRLDFNYQDGQYHFAPGEETGSEKLAGKVGHWHERQHFSSKITERELILPGYSPSAKWQKPGKK